jgi:hypothetical protein
LPAFVLTEPERRFLLELDARGVRFMVVGLTSAALQGANTTTVDIDLWFARIGDLQIAEAARAAGGSLVSGFGLMPAALAGPLGDRFDVVLTMSGLGTFDEEWGNTKAIRVEGIPLRILKLDRVLASKRAADRPKDRAVIPALEEALAAQEDET